MAAFAGRPMRARRVPRTFAEQNMLAELSDPLKLRKPVTTSDVVWTAWL